MGMKYELSDGKGNVIEKFDDRTLQEAKEDKIIMCKKLVAQILEKHAPEFKQRNAAMGVYSEDKNQEIVAIVQKTRLECDKLEAAIEAAKTIEELDNLDDTPLRNIFGPLKDD